MSEPVKIKVWVCTQIVGSDSEVDIEVDKDEWDSMNDVDKEGFCREEMYGMIEWNYHVTE